MSNIPYNIFSTTNSFAAIPVDPSLAGSNVWLSVLHFYAPSATVSIGGIPTIANEIVIKSSLSKSVDATDAAN